MSDGVIAERGTHKDLLAQNGLYAVMWARQSDGFIDKADDDEVLIIA